MGSVVVIDSGTTTTRARLVRDGAVVRTLTRLAGARDAVPGGGNPTLRSAVASLLEEHAAAGDLECALLSGMITSNAGLVEVPHLDAPAGLEEVEVLGLRALLDLRRDAVFLHLGSHDKAVDVTADGTILGSRTALTGELLAALREHTILRTSLAELDDLELDERGWREGIAAAERYGVGRALFLVRVGEQIGGRTRAGMTSFLLGVLASLDVPLLALHRRQERDVVLYGRGPLKEVLRAHLEEAWSVRAMVVDDATAEEAAVVGALAVYRRAREIGRAA